MPGERRDRCIPGRRAAARARAARLSRGVQGARRRASASPRIRPTRSPSRSSSSSPSRPSRPRRCSVATARSSRVPRCARCSAAPCGGRSTRPPTWRRWSASPRRWTYATAEPRSIRSGSATYAAMIARELGLSDYRTERVRLAGHPARHREGGRARRDPVQGRSARRGRVGRDEKASGDRSADPRHARARRHPRVGAGEPRAPRRQGLSRVAYPATRSRSRREILAVADAFEAMCGRPDLPARAGRAGGARGAAR